MNGYTSFAEYPSTSWNYGSGATNASEIFAPTALAGVAIERIHAQDFVKRCKDVIFAVLGIVLTLPLWVLIALAVKLTSKGPVLFVQERAGLHGRPFRMFKFRSMVVDAEERLKELVTIEDLAEPVYKLKDDPRVTRLGRFLRRFGLDELPQLLNVLRGEMSLVGPRPEVVPLVARYNADQRRRLLVKPGITGYQQIHNRGMPDMAARLMYDLYYLRNRSTPLDLWILAMTVFVITSGKEITY
jgi:lipopolysaccharide/colanic/teichoic acid biosynthesis glycosyltransferase